MCHQTNGCGNKSVKGLLRDISLQTHKYNIIQSLSPVAAAGVLASSQESAVVASHPDDALTTVGSRRRAAMLQLSEADTDQLATQDPADTLSLSERLLIESAAEKDRVSEMRIMPKVGGWVGH